MSLTKKIIAQLLAVTLVALVGYSAVELSKQLVSRERALHVEQEEQFQRVMSGISTALYEINLGVIKSILEPFLSDARIARIAVFDDSGKPIEELVNPRFVQQSNKEHMLPALADQQTQKLLEDRGHRIHALSLGILYQRPGAEPAYMGQLQVEYSSESVRQEVFKSFQTFFLWTTLFSITKVILMTIFTIRSVVRPVRLLAKASVSVGAGQYVMLPPASGDDEISQLTNRFNDMVSQLVEHKEFLQIIREESNKILAVRDLVDIEEQLTHSLSHAAGTMVTAYLLLNTEFFGHLVGGVTEGNGPWFRSPAAPRFIQDIAEYQKGLGASVACDLLLGFSGARDEPIPSIERGDALTPTSRSTVAHVLCTCLHDDRNSRVANAARALELSIATALQNISALAQEKHKMLLEHELEAAREIQQAIFTPPIPLEEVEMVSFYQSATRTGGDFYCFHYDQQHRTCYFFVGDVTGHGLGSALVTAMAAGALGASFSLIQKMSGTTQEKLIFLAQCVNQSLYQNGTRAGKLMTMAFVAVHLDTGRACYLNAGHPGILYVRTSKSQSVKLNNVGMRLGFTAAPQFKVLELQLEPDDILFLYTDGLTECPAQKGGPGLGTNRYQWGLRKISDILSVQNGDLNNISVTIQNLIKDVWAGRSPDDDLTYVALKWKGAGQRQQSAGQVHTQSGVGAALP